MPLHNLHMSRLKINQGYLQARKGIDVSVLDTTQMGWENGIST